MSITTKINKNNRVLSLVNKFKLLFSRGIIDWTEAARVIVRLVDDCVLSTDEIADICGGDFRVEHIDRFLRVGRGELLAPLLAANWPVATRLSRLPARIQKAALKGVDVVVDSRKGTGIVRLKAPEMTAYHGKQVFDGMRIRSAAEQLDFLNRKKLREKAAKQAYASGTALYYKIVDDMIVIDKPCRISYEDLVKMLEDLKETLREPKRIIRRRH